MVTSQKYLFTERRLHDFFFFLQMSPHICSKHHSYGDYESFPHKAHTYEQRPEGSNTLKYRSLQLSLCLTQFPKQTHLQPLGNPTPTITTLPSFYPAHSTVKKKIPTKGDHTQQRRRHFFSKKKNQRCGKYCQRHPPYRPSLWTKTQRGRA